MLRCAISITITPTRTGYRSPLPDTDPLRHLPFLYAALLILDCLYRARTCLQVRSPSGPAFPDRAMPSFRERQGGKAKETRAGETGQATAHTCCAESRGVPRLPPTRVRRGTRAGRHAAAHFSKSENACARCLLLLGCSNFSRE